MIRFKTVLFEPGETKKPLFRIHSGRIALFDGIPRGKDEDWSPPIAVYDRDWFINREALTRSPKNCHAMAMQDGQIISLAVLMEPLGECAKGQHWKAALGILAKLNHCIQDLMGPVP